MYPCSACLVERGVQDSGCYAQTCHLRSENCSLVVLVMIAGRKFSTLRLIKVLTQLVRESSMIGGGDIMVNKPIYKNGQYTVKPLEIKLVVVNAVGKVMYQTGDIEQAIDAADDMASLDTLERAA